MKFVLVSIAAAFVLLAGHMPASAATAGQALVKKPAYATTNVVVEKAGWRHRRWYRHRYYRGYRWGWRHRYHHRRWWW
jgi:hypothetical protein